MPTQTPPAEQFTLMWPADLREQVAHLAALDDRSVSATVRTALRDYIARRLPAAATPAGKIPRANPLQGCQTGPVVFSSHGNGDAA